MKQIPVASKIVRSVHFSQEDGQLRICFRNGEERRFDGVPERVVAEFVAAPSPGTYYLEHIRTRFARHAA